MPAVDNNISTAFYEERFERRLLVKNSQDHLSFSARVMAFFHVLFNCGFQSKAYIYIFFCITIYTIGKAEKCPLQ